MQNSSVQNVKQFIIVALNVKYLIGNIIKNIAKNLKIFVNLIVKL